MSIEQEETSSIDEPIPRSSRKIDPEAFQKALHLHNKHEWLGLKSNAFLELWNSCSTNQEQDLIFSLVDRFTFIGLLEFKRALDSLCEHILNKWRKSEGQRVLIVAVSDDAEADGSQFALQSLKNSFAGLIGWSEDNFINYYGGGLKEAKDGDLIVLLDDFIGTGNTICRKYTAFQKGLEKKGIKKVELKACALASMKFAKDFLDEQGIDCFAPVELEKGISDYFEGEDLTSSVDLMGRLEAKLKPRVGNMKLSDHLFGYGRSEALFCLLDNNVPNNVFPIFWWRKSMDNTERHTMFRRLKK